jgi:hypothetical protein
MRQQTRVQRERDARSAAEEIIRQAKIRTLERNAMETEKPLSID